MEQNHCGICLGTENILPHSCCSFYSHVECIRIYITTTGNPKCYHCNKLILHPEDRFYLDMLYTSKNDDILDVVGTSCDYYTIRIELVAYYVMYNVNENVDKNEIFLKMMKNGQNHIDYNISSTLPVPNILKERCISVSLSHFVKKKNIDIFKYLFLFHKITKDDIINFIIKQRFSESLMVNFLKIISDKKLIIS